MHDDLVATPPRIEGGWYRNPQGDLCRVVYREEAVVMGTAEEYDFGNIGVIRYASRFANAWEIDIAWDKLTDEQAYALLREWNQDPAAVQEMYRDLRGEPH